MTLTDAEKQEMKTNERTRALLERTEALTSEQHLALHGLTSLESCLPRLNPGDHVRICPRGRADVFDLALVGQSATVASVEQDFEGRVFYTVALDDDPGRDLGMEGKPGHRFFFRRDELEQISRVSLARRPRFLVAGVGNLFHGDDAFGSEVARRLVESPLPDDVRVVDFGIRGHDLAFALQDEYEAVVLIDVAQRGETPGCVRDRTESGKLRRGQRRVVDTHAMHPLRILRMIRANGGTLPRICFVACELLTFGPEEGQMGLSDRSTRQSLKRFLRKFPVEPFAREHRHEQ